MHMSTYPAGSTRVAGVLLHPTSLPGSYGIGDMGYELIAFLEWAASAGMRLWQVLPLNPPGYGYSPYGCLSSFAGNPLLIAPQRLLQDGVLDREVVAEPPQFDDSYIDFERVTRLKFAILRESWRTFQESPSEDLVRQLDEFIAAPEQQEWLSDYALYMALKEAHGGAPWWEWDGGLARHEPDAVAEALETHAEEIRFWQYLQWLFFRQWAVVREAARSRSIRIMGDAPIYVAWDSADVWSHRELFQLDENGHPTVVAGVPPDYFSDTGQRWGNPLYRWEAHAATNYAWWVERVRANLRFADVIRLDHFRGFAAYWEIPAHEPTAIHGRWMPGPGTELFDAIRDKLGDLPLVAEDLGFITKDVHDLRRAINVPGMRILQFGFGQNDSPHLPHRYEARSVVYTGTHDNDTARGWFESASVEEREAALTYVGCGPEQVNWGLIRAAYTSVADVCIVPAQDILGLGSEGRMNVPGAKHDNWSWRLQPAALTTEQAAKLRRLAELTGRV